MTQGLLSDFKHNAVTALLRRLGEAGYSPEFLRTLHGLMSIEVGQEYVNECLTVRS